ncbi:MAG: HNH endonuclease [Tyzzerella sp.]|nr:HNH endonuclease [Tyzzerella sp.]
MDEIIGQAHPYTGRIPDVADIDTHRFGRWGYSPYFTNPATSVDIRMTGSRYRDFAIANLGNAHHYMHGAGWTWHHVYIGNAVLNQNGNIIVQPTGNLQRLECKMQLVYTLLHQATCPHAGACKQYSEIMGVNYKNSYYDETEPCSLAKLYDSRDRLFEYSKDVYSLVLPRMSGLFQMIYYNLDEYLGKDYLMKYADGEKDTYEIMNFFSFGNGIDSIKVCWQKWEWELLEKGYFAFGTNAFGDTHIYDLCAQSYYGIYYHEEDRVYRRELDSYYCWGVNVKTRGECYESV